MATWTLVKKSAKKAAGPIKKLKTGDPTPGAFQFQDNEDSSVTIFGVDATGAQVDPSALMTFVVTSADPTKIGVDPVPAGSATFQMHGLAVGQNIEGRCRRYDERPDQRWPVPRRPEVRREPRPDHRPRRHAVGPCATPLTACYARPSFPSVRERLAAPGPKPPARFFSLCDQRWPRAGAAVRRGSGR